MCGPTMQIDQTIQSLCKLGLDRLDAQMLLLHALHKPTNHRAWILAHGSDEVPDEVQQRLADCALRRAQGEPLAYITGHKEFYGLDLRIDARVLLPGRHHIGQRAAHDRWGNLPHGIVRQIVVDF